MRPFEQFLLAFQNDTVYAAICNIQLIDLPIDEQKKIILMTLSAQQPHNLTIGGFQNLNVETFVYVSRKSTVFSSSIFNFRFSIHFPVNEEYLLRWYAFGEHTVAMKFYFKSHLTSVCINAPVTHSFQCFHNF